MYTMGALMLVLFFLRFVAFHLYESPKYLMGRGRDAEAVEVVHKVAAYNGKTSTLTLQMLQDAESVVTDEEKGEKAVMDTSVKAAISRKLRGFSGDHCPRKVSALLRPNEVVRRSEAPGSSGRSQERRASS